MKNKRNLPEIEDATILSAPELLSPMSAESSPLLSPISGEASGEGTGKAKIYESIKGYEDDTFDTNDSEEIPSKKSGTKKIKKAENSNFEEEQEEDFSSQRGSFATDDVPFPEPDFDEPDEFDEDVIGEDSDLSLPADYMDKEIPKQAKFLVDLGSNLIETLILQKYAIDLDSVRRELMRIPDMQSQVPALLQSINDYNLGFKDAISFNKDEKKLLTQALVNILKKYPAISEKISGEAQLGLAALTIGITKISTLKAFKDTGTQILTSIQGTINQYNEYYRVKTEQMRKSASARPMEDTQENSGKYGGE
jgi:hypothetical protein